MPNWCTNIIKANSQEDFNKIKKLLINENNRVDFEILIPRPEDVDIPSPSYLDCDKQLTEKIATLTRPLLKQAKNQKDFVQKARDVLKDINELDKFCAPHQSPSGIIIPIDNHLKALYNLDRYKAADWFEWGILYWSTKWNADQEPAFIDQDSFEFDTAWNPPFAVLEKLAQSADFSFFAEEPSVGLKVTLKTINQKLETVNMSDEEIREHFGVNPVNYYDEY